MSKDEKSSKVIYVTEEAKLKTYINGYRRFRGLTEEDMSDAEVRAEFRRVGRNIAAARKAELAKVRPCCTVTVNVCCHHH